MFCPGLQGNRDRHVLEPERKEAIRLALKKARSGDVVLIAGKGHEKVQITREGSSPLMMCRWRGKHYNRWDMQSRRKQDNEVTTLANC